MLQSAIFEDSDALAVELAAVVPNYLLDDSLKVTTSNVACSLSLEHWHAVRALLRSALLPSALVVHRAQFEAVTRSIWLAYAATDTQVIKFGEALTPDSEQATKNAPLVADMLHDLSKNAPRHAYEALARFKEASWKALNSYAHAGIHPMRRHEEGYPVDLIENALRNANGLGVMACMQAVVLSGHQPLQAVLLEKASKRPSCMPTPL